jgi:hypothetical protein
MHRLALVSLVLVLTAPACAENAPWTARPLPFATERDGGASLGALRFMGALELSSTDRRFGGLSGIAVRDGSRVTAISDRGYFVELDLDEDPAGMLVGASSPRIAPLEDAAGKRLRGFARDGEDVALLGDGTRLVVFEHEARLGWFAPGSAREERSASLLDLVGDGNDGIESVVPLGEGRLLLIAERLGEAEGTRRAWIGEPGQWEALDYVPEANEDVSGAAMAPGGDLLVLERAVSPLTGFSARLRRVAQAQLRPGARLQPVTLLELAPPALADNFEGVAVRPLPDGRVAIYLVSDDNYFPLQRTYLVKFETGAP